jgi:SAM-dependent methyltransferase
MDDTTARVRSMYEAFPYPADNAPTFRLGVDAELLLSYTSLARKTEKPFQVLDAGCGRGVGTLAAATLQPHAHFVGVDVNRVALDEARAQAKARGLRNVSFIEVDLMTLEGLEVPPGGFDVIYSSGVLHHLSDPATGLAQLDRVLAPHGVISLMVYGRRGRTALYNMVEAIDLLAPRTLPVPERLAFGRAFAQAVSSETLFVGPWQDGARVADAEFVDRYLNVNETSYNVRALFDLLTKQGLRFVRWLEPLDWAVEKFIAEGPARQRALSLPAMTQFELVDLLAHRPRLELVVSKASNPARSPLALNDETLDKLTLCVNPEVSFSLERRLVSGATRVESLSVQIRTNKLSVPRGPLAQTLLTLSEQAQPFAARQLTKRINELGVSNAAEVRSLLSTLLQLEIVYAPNRG